MRYGSVCSGIEAATMAWHSLGWESAFFSEIEAFPRAVLEHRYPNVPLHGDFTTIEENQYGKIDLLVGGTPCQSFSVAGLRGGLDDERGNLALEFCRLAYRERPRWIVWENVPGVLSSNGGRDFGSILGALADLGYGLAYRVLDAQYFGVAQRRRRVFVVGYLGDWRRAAAVLFERHSMSGHPAPSREARKDLAPTISARTKGGGGLGTDFDCDGGLVAGGRERFGVDVPAVSSCLTAGAGQRFDTDTDTDTFVSYAIQAGALRTNPNSGPDGVGVQADHAYTLEARSEVQAVAFAQNTRDEVRLVNGDGAAATEDCSPTLRAGAFTGSHQNGGVMTAVVYPIISDADRADSAAKTPSPDAEGRVRLRDPGLGVGGEADPMYTLQATKPHAVAFSIMPMNSGKDYKARETEVAQPIMAGGPVGGNQGGDFVIASAVRRLTPVECERLQGFPDGFTAIPWRKKDADQCPDGPRYKALGNSMAVPVMRWIGQRIQMIENLTDLL